MNQKQLNELTKLKKQWSLYSLLYLRRQLSDEYSVAPTVYILEKFTWDDEKLIDICKTIINTNNHPNHPVIAIRNTKEAKNIDFLIKEDLDTAVTLTKNLAEEYKKDTKEFMKITQDIISFSKFLDNGR